MEAPTWQCEHPADAHSFTYGCEVTDERGRWCPCFSAVGTDCGPR